MASGSKTLESDFNGQRPRTWSQLRAWDRIEEDEIKRFEHIRDKDTTMQRIWGKFRQHPVPFICMQIAFCNIDDLFFLIGYDF